MAMLPPGKEPLLSCLSDSAEYVETSEKKLFPFSNSWLIDGSHGHVSTQGRPFGAFRVPMRKI